jgi:hypothetical protein
LEVLGRNIYPWQSFHIITAIKVVSRWHLMKHSTEGSVDHQYVGMKLEGTKSLHRNTSKRNKRPLTSSEIVSRLLRAGRRVMQIRREDHGNLK